MQTLPLGTSNIRTTRLAYGCMMIFGKWNENDPQRARTAVLTAFEAGYRLFDHAALYRGGQCEEFFGSLMREVPELRREAVILTKGGIIFPPHGSNVPRHRNFSREHLTESLNGSLKRLGVDSVHVFLLHRPDVLWDLDEVASFFENARASGKVREFGVSNFTTSQIRALQSRLSFKLVTHEFEFSPARVSALDDGLLDQCQELRMSPLAWGPLLKGQLGTGGTVPDTAPNAEMVRRVASVLDEVAAAHGVTRAVAAIAWILRHPSNIIPIIGSATPARITEAAEATKLQLSREDWYRVYVAAYGNLP